MKSKRKVVFFSIQIDFLFFSFFPLLILFWIKESVGFMSKAQIKKDLLTASLQSWIEIAWGK